MSNNCDKILTTFVWANNEENAKKNSIKILLDECKHQLIKNNHNIDYISTIMVTYNKSFQINQPHIKFINDDFLRGEPDTYPIKVVEYLITMQPTWYLDKLI